MALIDRDNCTLFVIDVQGRLLPAVESPKQTLANIAALVEVALLLDVPIAYSEQYPPRSWGHGRVVTILTQRKS